MKAAAAATVALLVGATLLPALLAGGDSPPPTRCSVAAGPIELVLATIREAESSGDYRAQSPGSSASGAYQFLDSSWDGYGGYSRAKDAPPEMQDAKAAEQVQAILNAHGGDVTTVPVAWYLGHVPEPASGEWDAVPAPDAGNRLTPRQYQAKWMEIYRRHVGAATTSTTGAPMATSEPPTASCIGGTSAPTIDGEWSLPGPRELIDANPSALNDAHHDYPAWDWLIPEGTPIYAIRGGTVTSIRTWPHNWWTMTCGPHGHNDCDTCGIGVTITDHDGARWTYCHGSSLTAELGAIVHAGQQLMWSGNSGRSGTPHLHVEVSIDGIRRCPQQLMVNLYTSATAVSPRTLPDSGCSF